MEFKKKKLPIYKMKINTEDSGVDFVALVDQPAIEKTWQAFAENKKYEFKRDEEKQIVSGYLMLADTPIYRRDDNLGEYYVMFEADTIEKIMKKFAKNGFHNNVNLMHNKEAKVNSMFMIESFMIDSKRGIKAPKGHDQAPDGSWFGSYYVEDVNLWNSLKTGDQYAGFSVEGLFNYDLEENMRSEKLEDYLAVIKEFLAS